MNKKFIMLKIGRERYKKIFPENIIYLQADGNYTNIKIESENDILICSNLKNTLKIIENDNLIKINRSTVINYTKVSEFIGGKKTIIKLYNSEEFTVTKPYIKNVKAKIINKKY